MVCVEVLLHLRDTPEAAQRCVLPTLRGSSHSTALQDKLCCVSLAVTSLPLGALGLSLWELWLLWGAGLAGALHRLVCDADGQGQTLQALDGLGKVQRVSVPL